MRQSAKLSTHGQFKSTRSLGGLADAKPPAHHNALNMKTTLRRRGDGTAAATMWRAEVATGVCMLSRGCEIALGASETLR